MFDPRAAQGLKASYELTLGEDVFRAVVTDGRFLDEERFPRLRSSFSRALKNRLTPVLVAGHPLLTYTRLAQREKERRSV